MTRFKGVFTLDLAIKELSHICYKVTSLHILAALRQQAILGEKYSHDNFKVVALPEPCVTLVANDADYSYSL